MHVQWEYYTNQEIYRGVTKENLSSTVVKFDEQNYLSLTT